MKKQVNITKNGSVMKIGIGMITLMLSGLIGLLPNSPILFIAEAGSQWTETTWSSTDNYASISNVDTTSTPGDVKLSKDVDLYIADTGNDRIVKTKMDGSGWTTLGGFGSPGGIYFDSGSGYVYVADTSNCRIVKTKMDGTGWTTYGICGSQTGRFSGPMGIYFDSGSGDVYVADEGNSRIVKTKMGGAGWTTYGTWGTGTGEFNGPFWLHYDSGSGYVYVADDSNHHIVKTKMDGTEWITYGTEGADMGQFDRPEGIYFDSGLGDIYVAEYNNHRIVKTKMGGAGWTTFGTEGAGVGQFDTLFGLSFDSSSGYVYVADTSNRRIVKTKMDGTGWTTFGAQGAGVGQFSSLRGIAVGPKTYFSNGTLVSKPYDIGLNSVLKAISWNAGVNLQTSVKFQLRTASSEGGLTPKDFVGPSGSTNNYYTTSGENIWSGHDGERYVQYKVYLTTRDSEETPILEDVTINYNCLPDAPTLNNPVDGIWTNDSSPIFSWTFNDVDSISQDKFEWQADDDSEFGSIDYNSYVVTSSTPSYIPSPAMNDGFWYWRVKTEDMDGDWGDFSETRQIGIDTTPPAPPTKIDITPNDWTNTNSFNISWTNPSEGITSGVKTGAWYHIGSSEPVQADGTWVDQISFTINVAPEGDSTIYIWLEDRVGNTDSNNFKNGTLKLV